MKNFWYLFSAYTIIWAVLFGYLFNLIRVNRALWKELEGLKSRVSSRAPEGAGKGRRG